MTAETLSRFHCGRKGRPWINKQLKGPNTEITENGIFCEAMTEKDMDEVVTAFANAAEYAVSAGFDMALIHAGHSWLLEQFLSPLVNKRTDEYGGSLENRMRFPLRVLKAIRDRVGNKLIVALRISGSERAEGGFTPADMAEFLSRAEEYVDMAEVSTENWNRPEAEVSALMGLVLANLEDEIFQKNNVRFRVIGDVKRLPVEVQQKLRETEEHTKGNTAMTMVVALSYSSRWEITQAVKNIIEEQKNSSDFSVDDITEKMLSEHMQTSFMPDPDLLIRTGGELRISNYLLWQIAYSELYFCDTYWPDFKEEDLHKAIADYQNRQRRFGKTEAQIEGAEK